MALERPSVSRLVISSAIFAGEIVLPPPAPNKVRNTAIGTVRRSMGRQLSRRLVGTTLAKVGQMAYLE
jgi:hypothetical protein